MGRSSKEVSKRRRAVKFDPENFNPEMAYVVVYDIVEKLFDIRKGLERKCESIDLGTTEAKKLYEARRLLHQCTMMLSRLETEIKELR